MMKNTQIVQLVVILAFKLGTSSSTYVKHVWDLCPIQWTEKMEPYFQEHESQLNQVIQGVYVNIAQCFFLI